MYCIRSFIVLLLHKSKIYEGRICPWFTVTGQLIELWQYTLCEMMLSLPLGHVPPLWAQMSPSAKVLSSALSSIGLSLILHKRKISFGFPVALYCY